jgi:geranylgeranyl diphosphate synthase type II
MSAPPGTFTFAPADLDVHVAALLEEVVTSAAARAARFGQHYPMLWGEIGRSVRGGKRFRSGLVLGTHAGLGAPYPEAAVNVAAAFELLHTAFLVHDDLIDGDRVRRGQPNLAETMRLDALARGHDEDRAERWATAAALLAGDLALAQAHRLVAEADVLPVVRRDLLDLLDDTVQVSVGGELVDTACGLGLHDPTLEESLGVAEAKTAQYSFRAPLRAGALVAGADGAVLLELDVHGTLLGRAFQLVDDLLGVFAPASETGKSDVSDLREGKRTPLLLHAMRLPVWREIEQDVGRPDLDDATAARVRVALARSLAPGLVERAVLADLAEVDRRLVAGALPAGVAAVVAGVVTQIRVALAGVLRHVAAAAAPTGHEEDR